MAKRIAKSRATRRRNLRSGETPHVAAGQCSINGAGEVVIYQASDGGVQLDVRLEKETVWLTQRQMALLFKTSTDNISLHLKNIYKDRELDESATTEEYSAVQKEGRRGVRRRLQHYNLDAIISVGYRVNSKRGTWRRDPYPVLFSLGEGKLFAGCAGRPLAAGA